MRGLLKRCTLPGQRQPDRLEHIVCSDEHIVVPESHHAETEFIQFPCSLQIGFRLIHMLSAIDLDDEICIETREVGNEASDWNLPTELESPKSSVAKSRPEPAFGIGHCRAQLARRCDVLPVGHSEFLFAPLLLMGACRIQVPLIRRSRLGSTSSILGVVGNCSVRCPTSSIHGVVGNCSVRCSTSSILGVVVRPSGTFSRKREKEDMHFRLVILSNNDIKRSGGVSECRARFSFSRKGEKRFAVLRPSPACGRRCPEGG